MPSPSMSDPIPIQWPFRRRNATRVLAMSLSLDDVMRLARLARIDLDADAADDVRGKLDAIFHLIDALQSIDTAGIEPMAHAQDVAMPLRDDVVAAENCRDRYQAQAPAVAGGLYLVPKVIE
jgi:aspartyl-tRNA(Asn)/glutamyl-tRNA(Gln) amidotransferase subunit C